MIGAAFLGCCCGRGAIAVSLFAADIYPTLTAPFWLRDVPVRVGGDHDGFRHGRLQHVDFVRRHPADFRLDRLRLRRVYGRRHQRSTAWCWREDDAHAPAAATASTPSSASASTASFRRTRPCAVMIFIVTYLMFYSPARSSARCSASILTTSFTGAVASMGNVGPGFGRSARWITLLGDAPRRSGFNSLLCCWGVWRFCGLIQNFFIKWWRVAKRYVSQDSHIRAGCGFPDRRRVPRRGKPEVEARIAGAGETPSTYRCSTRVTQLQIRGDSIVNAVERMRQQRARTRASGSSIRRRFCSSKAGFRNPQCQGTPDRPSQHHRAGVGAGSLNGGAATRRLLKSPAEAVPRLAEGPQSGGQPLFPRTPPGGGLCGLRDAQRQENAGPWTMSTAISPTMAR